MRILLCTDGSLHGQAALRFGALLARGSSEPATLLGVVEKPGERARIERALDEGSRWLAGTPEPHTRIREGQAAVQILKEASPEAYDLVVVGARGRRGITRLLIGSTAQRVAAQARLPVLVVRGDRRTVERMLICTGGREPGLSVVEFGGRVAKLVDAKVTVLHVMSQLTASPMLPEAGVLKVMPQTPAPPDPEHLRLEELEASAEELMAGGTREGVHLRQALDILADKGVTARALVRHGLVVDEVGAEIEEGDYDLVVAGTQRAVGWMRLFLKDVAEEIADCCSQRPFLIVRV